MGFRGQVNHVFYFLRVKQCVDCLAIDNVGLNKLVAQWFRSVIYISDIFRISSISKLIDIDDSPVRSLSQK